MNSTHFLSFRFLPMPERPIHCLKECAKRNRGTPLIGRRFYSAYAANADDLGPVVQDEHQSFRVLRDGKKLPLPPVLDPVVLSERSRWERPKEKPNVSKFTPFQKKLWENPYGISPRPFNCTTSSD